MVKCVEWEIPSWLSKMVIVLLLVLYIASCSMIILWATKSETVNPGVQLVKAMYQFNSPDELVANQEVVQGMLVSEEWKRLTVDEPLRNVNAYRKFGYSSSRVQIVEATDGFVVYKLLNENIQPSQLWVLEYDVNQDGLLYNIKEYRAAYQTNGGYYLS